MEALLHSTNCCPPDCDDPTIVNLPGAQGAPGTDGDDGAAGVNAFTTLTAGFVMPAEGADVTITVASTAWMVPRVITIQGQILDIQYAGRMEVRSITDATHAVVRNISVLADGVYPENAPATTAIPSGARVSPGGIQGPPGEAPVDSLLAANNLNDLDNAATARTNLGLTAAASTPVGIADNDLVPVDDAAGLTAGEALFATASGIETKGVVSARSALGLGTMAVQSASAVNISGGSLTGITDLAVADGGTGGSDAATARTNLGVLPGYGLLGELIGVSLNSASTDYPITILSGRYRIDRVTVDNASVNLTAATAGLFTAALGGGTALATDQALSALTASSKFKDLTLNGVVGTDVVTAGTIYFRVGTDQGVPSSANVKIFGWKLD